MDPDPHPFSLLDPYPGGKKDKTEKIKKKLVVIVSNFFIISGPSFFLLSNIFFLFQLQKTLR